MHLSERCFVVPVGHPSHKDFCFRCLRFCCTPRSGKKFGCTHSLVRAFIHHACRPFNQTQKVWDDGTVKFSAGERFPETVGTGLVSANFAETNDIVSFKIC
jgi:hypothetical protein